MNDPSRRLVPSAAPDDHPIHDGAEAGHLARVRAFLDQEPAHDVMIDMRLHAQVIVALSATRLFRASEWAIGTDVPGDFRTS